MTRIKSDNTLTGTPLGLDTLPDIEGCLGEWWFGTDAASSPNRITGVAPTVVTAATFTAADVKVGYHPSEDGALGLLLDADLTDTFTWMMLFRQNTLSHGWIAHAAADPTNASLTTYLTDGITCGNGASHGATDQAVLPCPDSALPGTQYNFAMGIGLLGTRARIITVSGAGATAAMDDGSSGTLPTSRPASQIQLGARVDANRQGYVFAAAFAAFSNERGSDFAREVYRRWKVKATARGLTVA